MRFPLLRSFSPLFFILTLLASWSAFCQDAATDEEPKFRQLDEISEMFPNQDLELLELLLKGSIC